MTLCIELISFTDFIQRALTKAHVDNTFNCERWRRRSAEREGKEDEVVCSSEMQIWNLPLETHRFWVCMRRVGENIHIFQSRRNFFLREQITRAAPSQVMLVFLKVFYLRNCSGSLPFARPRSNTLRICGISQTEYNTDFSAKWDCIIYGMSCSH